MAIVLLSYILEGILCYAIGMPDATIETCDLLSIVLLLINMIILIVFVNNYFRDHSQRVINAMILSVILKVFLIIWDYYGAKIFTLPNSHSDTESFHYWAVMFARGRTNTVENYSYVVGFIYRFFGIQRMTAQFFNTILSFAGICLFNRILGKVEISEYRKECALIFAALLPNYLIFSAILSRECLISVLLCLSLYMFIMWWYEGNLACLATAYLVDLAACYFHPGSIAVGIGISFALILTTRDLKGGRNLHIGPTSIIMAGIVLIAFVFLFQRLSDVLFRKFQGLQMNAIDHYIDEHGFYDADNSDGSSTYRAGIPGLSGLSGLVINSPIRMLYFLWVPMPWMIRGIGDIIAFFGSSLFYGGTAFRGVGRINKISPEKKGLYVVVLLTALAGALVFAWGTDSAGSALRHREKFLFVYLLLFAMLGNKNRSNL